MPQTMVSPGPHLWVSTPSTKFKDYTSYFRHSIPADLALRSNFIYIWNLTVLLLFAKGAPSCCQCNYSHTVKMRYQKEIEGILRILHEFDSRTKNEYEVLNNLNWEGNGRHNNLASLGHILASMNALFKLRNETFMFISRISKIHMANSDEDRKPCTIPELTFRAKVHEKVIQKWMNKKI